MSSVAVDTWANLCTDFPPGFKSDVHFTQTIGECDLTPIRYCKLKVSQLDYLIVVHGELEMILHDGSSKTVRAGDAIVQIGNIHGWNNNTTDWASESPCASI